MSQNVELNKVKARIKALSNKTVERGCSEHEAMEAMAAVGRLLTQYNLTMNEIDVREQVCKTVMIPVAGQRRGPIDGCIMSLCKLFHARVWFSKAFVKVDDKWTKVTSYGVFGTETDIEMIQYLIETIQRAIDTETAAFKKTEVYYTTRVKKSATVSFGHGMAARIAQRLGDMKAEMDAAEASRAATGRSLIVLKGQLIEEEFKNLNLRLRSSYSTKRANDYGAYHKGREAGGRVNLSRPIGGGNKVGGYLS